MQFESLLPGLKAEGFKALNTYHRLQYTSKEVEDAFLAIFEQIKKGLEDYYTRNKLTIIKFPHDSKDFRQLPDMLTIYRGYREPEKRLGISWTLSRTIAEGFSFDAALPQEAGQKIGSINGVQYNATKGYTKDEAKALPSRLITGKCNILDVLAYTNSRYEQEIIINPRNVTDIFDVTPNKETKRKTEVINAKLAQGKKSDRLVAEPLNWLLTTKQH